MENFFKRKKFDIVQVEVTYLLNLIHILPKDAIKVFVQIENRYSLLADHFMQQKQNDLYSEYIIRNAAFTEFALMNQYDYVFALTQKD